MDPVAVAHAPGPRTPTGFDVDVLTLRVIYTILVSLLSTNRGYMLNYVRGEAGRAVILGALGCVVLLSLGCQEELPLAGKAKSAAEISLRREAPAPGSRLDTRWRRMGTAELASEVGRADGEVLIGFKDSAAVGGVDERGLVLTSPSVVAEMTAELRSRGVTIRHEYRIIPAVSAHVRPELVDSLLADPRIEYVEPNFPGRVLAQDTTWNVKRVKADSVWATTTGSGVKLLVIDNGADTSHADLDYAYVSGGCASANGINYDNHGLRVAGVAAATSNSTGLIGIAHGVALYSIDASYNGTETIIPSYAECAVEEGIINGMDVMNLSFGLSTHTGLTDAINNACYQHGIVIVGATGNSGNGQSVLYPASLEAVIAVGGTTANNALWSGSHTGSQVELVAPAAGVPHLCSSQPYCTVYVGTSFSAPHVAAGVALLLSYNGSWTPTEIRRRLAFGATDLGSAGRDNNFGFGLLNVEASLNAAAPDTALVTVDGPTLVKPFSTCVWTADISGGDDPFTLLWSPGGSSTNPLEYSNTHNHGESFTITASVIGHDLAPSQGSLVVNVSSSAPECPS